MVASRPSASYRAMALLTYSLGGGLHVSSRMEWAAQNTRPSRWTMKARCSSLSPVTALMPWISYQGALFRRQFRGLANQRLVEGADGRPQQRIP